MMRVVLSFLFLLGGFVMRVQDVCKEVCDNVK